MKLTKIDVTRYRIGDTIWGWLMPQGFVIKYDRARNRVYLVK